MRVAVINEISACAKNMDIMAALELTGVDAYNVGMTNQNEIPSLTYIHTGLASAMLLNADACDLVVGGCGTGQGYLNSVMQYPGVFAGLILEPLDALLFARINAGNCISLALNKGYGWAGDINLQFIFEKLFSGDFGRGYPEARAESQSQSREDLKKLSESAHRPFLEIVSSFDKDALHILSQLPALKQALERRSKKRDIAEHLLSMLDSVDMR